MNGRRALVVQKVAEGKSQKEIAEELGYKSADGVNQALKSMDVREQIQLTRTEMFEAARIDRVEFLKDIYGKITVDQGEIFKVLRGKGDFLDARNLEKLTSLQSRLIQQVEVEPQEFKDSKGNKSLISIVKKVRFHNQDAAMKILARAAGFEDGVMADALNDGGGPFRGLIIIPPKEVIDIPSSGEGPPENGL